MLLPLMSTGAAAPVLRFADCKSGRPIVLVGCMHYNPVSVALAERVVTLRTGDDVAALGESECPICRDEFDVGSRVIKMPCARTHVFHRDCVARWLRKDDSCPLCRSSLPIWLGRPQYA